MINVNIPVIIFLLTGIYALWTFGFRRQFLDATRLRLFSLRSTLFNIAADGKIGFNDPAYRLTEVYLNNFIKYTHQLNFLRIFVRAKLYKNNNEGKEFTKNLIENINKYPDAQVRNELNQIIVVAGFLMLRQAFFSNLITYIIFIFAIMPFFAIILVSTNKKIKQKDKIVPNYDFKSVVSKKFANQKNFLEEDAFYNCNI